MTETSAAIPRMAQSHGNRPSAEGGSGETSDAGPSREELSPDVSSDMGKKYDVMTAVWKNRTGSICQ